MTSTRCSPVSRWRCQRASWRSYRRLGDLLDIELRDEWPRVAAFDAVVALSTTSAAGWPTTCRAPAGISRLPGRTHHRVIDRPMRVPDVDDPQQLDAAALAGGLPLGDGAFLLGHPPVLVHDLPETVALEIDGRYAGELDPGRVRQLDDIAQQLGTHTLWVGDTAELVFELSLRGRREAIGTLRHHLADSSGLAARATDTPPAGVPGGPVVAGALISGDGEHPLPAPVMVRHNTTVEVIYADGAGRGRPAADPVRLAGGGRHRTR